MLLDHSTTGIQLISYSVCDIFICFEILANRSNNSTRTRNECDPAVLKKNNKELAYALNNTKECCHVLTQRINTLNAENMDLRKEVCMILNFICKRET